MVKIAKVKTKAKSGEQSYEGIVASKPAGKAVMAGEPTQGCRCKPRLKRRGLDAKPGSVEEKQIQFENYCNRQNGRSYPLNLKFFGNDDQHPQWG